MRAFEELAFAQTPLGDLSLRRRQIAVLENEVVYEIKLGAHFLMSSLFHEVEEALADLGLAACSVGALDVVVGGLGLGYTARAALRIPRVRSLLVIDLLPDVISWHRSGLVPLGPELTSDDRCRLQQGDFFSLALSKGFDPLAPSRKYDAVLLDIDHSPKNLLAEANAVFYQPDGLHRLAAQLQPGGVFALWSDDPPDDDFLGHLNLVFPEVRSHIVTFFNPLLERESASTVYVARTGL